MLAFMCPFCDMCECPTAVVCAGKPRAATVVSQTPGVVWRLSRQAFRAALQSARGDPGNMVLHTLRSCELLDCLTNGQLVMLADLLQPVRGWNEYHHNHFHST